MEKTLIVLLGPTGIGKTSTSIKVAQHFNTEIISSDSRQVFKELSIGTAVPSPEELNSCKHHFIQTKTIHDKHNASIFETESLILLDRLFRKKNIVLMVGGSMLYIDALCNGIDDLPSVDQKIRDDLVKTFESEGLDGLRIQLKTLDPTYYAEVDLKNPKRILHALEITIMTGKPYSSFRTKKIKPRPFNIIKIGINTDRELLYNRINQRVEEMMQVGLLEEAKTVFPFKGINSLHTVGYKELFSYFNGEISREEAVELIKKNTRNYARKQLSWFRRDKSITWFDINQSDKIINFLETKLYGNSFS